jgi:O-antigen/teichoic acid export membrane protein
MTRTIRAVANFSSALGFQILTLSIGIFSTPLLLSWLGDDRYGAFRAASDWGNYLNLLELGLGGSLTSLLAKAVGSGSYENIYSTLITGIRAYLKIALLMIPAAIGLGIFITELVPVKGALINELQTGYWLSIVLILMLPLNPFRLLADASQRGYIVILFLSLQSVAITVLSLFFAWAKLGIVGQYLAVIVGIVFFQLTICWDVVCRYPNFFGALKKLKFQKNTDEQQLWKLNRSTFILNLSNQLSLFTDNIIISYSLGPATVVPFFITQRLAVLAQLQLQGISNSSWAALAELYNKGELEKFNTRTIELTRLVAVLGCALMIPIVAYNHHFIKLWVGADRFGGDLVTILAASNGFLLGILSLWGWLFTGTGQQGKLVRLNVIATTINLGLSLTCTHFFGIIGPLLGSFTSFVTISLWQLPRIMRSVFGVSIVSLFVAVIKPLLVGIPYAALVWWFSKHHQPWGWIGLAMEMGLTLFGYFLIAWWLVLNKLEHRAWIDRFKTLAKQFQR